MIFRAVCPHCFEQYELNESLIGKTAQCRNCRHTFLLERSSETLTLVPGSAIENSSDDSSFVGMNVSDGGTTKVSQLNAKDSGIFTAMKLEDHPDSQNLWKVGDLILGTYEVKPLSETAEYAEGGVGVVQRVYHREWDMDLAVKSPKQNAFSTEAGKESYERECQTWIELGLHTNIVTCYMVRRIGGIPRIFAEFIPDGSLRDWIKNKKLYTGTQEEILIRLIDVAIQFAWGLEHAHRQGLLHLDVKPANVMVSGEVVKVTDFGLAQATGVAEKVDTGVFRKDDGNEAEAAAPQWEGMTPGYCSPEQFMAFVYHQRGETELMPVITLQSDIWSWAICILSMFHGRAPCKKGGQTAAKVFELYLQSPPSQDRPQMPSSLVELMRHCFQEAPEKRPKSMADIAERLLEIYREIAKREFPRRKPGSAIWTAESINNRAVSMLDLDKPRETKRLLKQAAAMQPWQPEVTYNQTLLAWRNGLITDIEAVEQLENLVRMRRDRARAYYGLGLVQRERGNPASALEPFSKAIALEDRDVIRRMYAGAEDAASRAVRCIEQLMIQHDAPHNAVWIDEKEEQLLVGIDKDTIELREAATGRKGLSFRCVKDRSVQRAQLAVSEDMLWEIVRDPGASQGLPDTGNKFRTSLILRSIRNPGQAIRFNSIPWGGRRDANGGVQLETSKEIYTGKSETLEIRSRKSGEQLAELRGHTDDITAIAISPDERWFCSGGNDRTLRLWELGHHRGRSSPGHCIRTFAGLEQAVDAVFLSKSNGFMITLLRNGSLRFWDVSLLEVEPFHAPLMLCLVASSEELGRRQAEMNELRETISDSITKGEFAKTLAALAKAEKLPNWESIRGKAVPWDVLSRNCIREKPIDAICSAVLQGHQETVSTVAVSLDGRLAASAGRDNEIRIWNLESGNPVREIDGHYDWIRSIVLSQDTKFLISGSWDQSVRVWSLASGQCVRTLPDKIKSITQIALNPQGRILAVANGAGIMIFWDILSDSILSYRQAHRGAINSIRFSRDGRFIITAGDDSTVRIWDLASGENIRTITTHKSPLAAALMTTDLSKAVSVGKDGGIHVWDIKNDLPLFQVQGHIAEVTAIDNMGDDRFLITTSKDSTMRIWNLLDGSLMRTIESQGSALTSFGMNLAGNRFVTGSEDAAVRVWDVFWRFSYPERFERAENAETLLRTLLSLYCPPGKLNVAPKVDDNVIQRIRLEMEYRGYGRIRPEETRKAIEKLEHHWPGPVEI